MKNLNILMKILLAAVILLSTSLGYVVAWAYIPSCPYCTVVFSAVGLVIGVLVADMISER
tara:strand:+ start:909 stop:1088 length:180 start_codon:yes stop_codon:yes gene_type:complete